MEEFSRSIEELDLITLKMVELLKLANPNYDFCQ